MALGAGRRRVLSDILSQTFATAIVGITFGVVGALAATKLLATFLFGVEPRDPLTFAGVAALLAATALVAGYLPGRRAASIDPVRALKGQ